MVTDVAELTVALRFVGETHDVLPEVVNVMIILHSDNTDPFVEHCDRTFTW